MQLSVSSLSKKVACVFTGNEGIKKKNKTKCTCLYPDLAVTGHRALSMLLLLSVCVHAFCILTEHTQYYTCKHTHTRTDANT